MIVSSSTGALHTSVFDEFRQFDLSEDASYVGQQFAMLVRSCEAPLVSES
jgi:hypothetical protein